jgi:hypothetical protein
MSQVVSDKAGNVNTNGLSGTYVQIGAVRYYGFDTAITANVTTTTAPVGSQGSTTHATGRGKLFYSDGTKWQFDAIT